MSHIQVVHKVVNLLVQVIIRCGRDEFLVLEMKANLSVSLYAL